MSAIRKQMWVTGEIWLLVSSHNLIKWDLTMVKYIPKLGLVRFDCKFTMLNTILTQSTLERESPLIHRIWFSYDLCHKNELFHALYPKEAETNSYYQYFAVIHMLTFFLLTILINLTSLSGFEAHSRDRRGDLDISVAHVLMSGWLVHTLYQH